MDAMRALRKFPTGKRKFEMSWKFLYALLSFYFILLLTTDMSDENMKRAAPHYSVGISRPIHDQSAHFYFTIIINKFVCSECSAHMYAADEMSRKLAG